MMRRSTCFRRARTPGACSKFCRDSKRINRGRFNAILSTSDYQFQRVLFEEAHSPTYLEVFYLGEMTRGDAAALAGRLARRSVGEELLDRVGG